jgi:hypothetical protein
MYMQYKWTFRTRILRVLPRHAPEDLLVFLNEGET